MSILAYEHDDEGMLKLVPLLDNWRGQGAVLMKHEDSLYGDIDDEEAVVFSASALDYELKNNEIELFDANDYDNTYSIDISNLVAVDIEADEFYVGENVYMFLHVASLNTPLQM